MKKFIYILLISLLIITGIGVGVETEIEANALGMNFDIELNSPRFQYLEDDNNVTIPFEMFLLDEFESPEEADEVVVTLNQVYYDGTYVKRLEEFETNYTAIESHIEDSSIIAYAIGALLSIEIVYLGGLNILDITAVVIEGADLGSSYYYYDDEIESLHIMAGNSSLSDEIIIYYNVYVSATYESLIYYNWSDIQWLDENIIFYQLKLDNFVIFTGSVMKSPESNLLPYDDYGIEIGEFISIDDGFADYTDQSDFTSYIIEDEYIILHYRFPSTLILPDYKVIRVTDINSNTTFDLLTTENIMILQGGGDNVDRYNSYIILPINNEIGDGLVTWYPQINDYYNQVLGAVYEEGSYLFAIENQLTGNSLLAVSSVVWNIMPTLKDPFEMSAFKDNISAGDLQRILFYKNSELISSSYDTVLAYDSRTATDFTDFLNTKDITYGGSYYIQDDAIEGSCTNVTWHLDPTFLPYSLDVTDYRIELTDSYCIVGDNNIAGIIDNFLIDYAMETELGGFFFSTIILLIVNFLLIFITRSSFIFSVVNIVVMLGLSYLVAIPLWLTIALTMIALFGIRLVIAGGSKYE